MWTKSINFEVILICFLSLIPWPGPSVFKISCSRESARVVRKIVQSKWLPILEKYQVKIPLECPFHPQRDIFGPQQAAKKQNRPSQWTCGFCGKSFFEEKHLDTHFESRHKSNINMGEDAICLADYCDIMRCKVLAAKDSTLSFGDTIMSTDIEIWREASTYRTAIQPSGPRDLAKLPIRFLINNIYTRRNNFLPSLLRIQSSKLDDEQHFIKTPSSQHCDKLEKSERTNDPDDSEDPTDEDYEQKNNEDGDEENDSNATSSCDGNLVDSALPPVDRKQQRLSELQKMKANCKSEELEKLKMRCEILVRNCIVGMLVQMSDEDFKNMEEELNRAVCWYLTCDRYWEDGPIEQRAFPWGLVFVLVMVLSLGVCFCYYIIWILFDTDDHTSIPSASSQHTSHSSPSHQHFNAIANYHHPQQLQPHGSGLVTGAAGNLSGGSEQQSNAAMVGWSEELYSGAEFGEVGQSEHYIYVTYPPELKRRLLESCYNRTTRL